jgi:hypothetical protein
MLPRRHATRRTQSFLGSEPVVSKSTTTARSKLVKLWSWWEKIRDILEAGRTPVSGRGAI